MSYDLWPTVNLSLTYIWPFHNVYWRIERMLDDPRITQRVKYVFTTYWTCLELSASVFASVLGSAFYIWRHVIVAIRTKHQHAMHKIVIS